MFKRRLYDYPLWNLFLLFAGSSLITLSVQSVAAPYGFLTGGIMGLGLLSNYLTGFFDGTTWNFIYNIPLLIFGFIKISRSFILYTLFGTVCLTLWGFLLSDVIIPVQEPLYACIISGVLFGLGGGIMLRSKGSSGGLDILGVYLNQKWNMSIGGVAFAFNSAIFSVSLFTISVDMVIISFIQVFIVKQVTNYVLGMFNQQKMVFIVTSKGHDISDAIAKQGGRTTLMPAYGGYRHDNKEILMTITTNATIRALEEAVFQRDPDALFTVENTFYVSGGQYKKAKR